MSKTRLEAFSDGMFAIILTVLVLELHVPELENNSFAAFSAGMTLIAPKLLAFLFSFFIIAIFWVNHHTIVHHIEQVDTKLLWINTGFLFFACLFPFITAFVGDYMMNPYVVALYPFNMGIVALVLTSLWKYAYVDTKLAPNKMTGAEKRKKVTNDRISVSINFIAAALTFVWVPITLAIMVLMPFAFVAPEFLAKKKEAA